MNSNLFKDVHYGDIFRTDYPENAPGSNFKLNTHAVYVDSIIYKKEKLHRLYYGFELHTFHSDGTSADPKQRFSIVSKC